MAAVKYLDLTGLQINNDKIKELVSTGDAKAFKSAKFDDSTRILSLYKSETTEGTADFTVEIPETDVSGLLEKIADGTVGNIVTVGVNGVVVDSGIALSDLATKEEVETVSDKVDSIENAENGILAQAKEYVDAEVKELADGAVADNTSAIETLTGDETKEGSVAKAVKDSSDAINAVIGTVEEGKTVMGIIQNIQENAYDDTELRELIDANTDAIDAHKEAIDGVVTTLVGDDGNKSVRTIANEELVKQLIPENAQESLDTLEEIATWIQSHPDDASAMNKAIEDLEALVGTLPEDVTATTIVGYIDELVAEIKIVADGAVQEVVSGTANGTIAVDGVDVAVTGLGTAAYKSDTDFDIAGSANAAEVNSKSYTDALANGQVKTNTDAIVALETKVGDGIEAITEAEIEALFND